MRRTVIVALAAAAMVFAGQAAWGKVPPFDIEVSPTTVAAGEPITVTVTLDTTDFPAEELPGLVGFAAGSPDLASLRPLRDHVEVPLVRVQPGVYQGDIQTPTEAGEYVVVPFPTAIDFEDSPVIDRYPQPVAVTVTEPAAFTEGAWSAVAVVALGAMVLVGRQRWRLRRGSAH